MNRSRRWVLATSVSAIFTERTLSASSLFNKDISESSMQPRIGVLTLAVNDLERSLSFYREGLGLTTPGIVGTEFEHGKVAFFEFHGGLILALYGRDDLAWDAGVKTSAPSQTEFSLGHNVRSKDEVDSVMSQARRAGATVIKDAQPTFWGGYAGYFADPDGHLWEVLFNPNMAPKD